MNITCNFSPTQNNGRIVSSVDGVTGENVSYTYDSLNRLIAASTAGTTGVQWGNSYSYDGFGNLTAKVVTKGTAPSVYPQVNSATNRASMLYDNGFDANGNWLGAGGSQTNTWNVENQLISNGSVDGNGNLLTYTYDPWGKRVMQFSTSPGAAGSGTLYFYSITGHRLGSVRANRSGQTFAYYPWGEERTSTPDDQDKFATYFRDGFGEDYASARYYNSNFGRFWSPDPAGIKTADPRNPTSWNMYAYAGGDPVNWRDPTGLFLSVLELGGDGGDDGGDPDICMLSPDMPGCGVNTQVTFGNRGAQMANLPVSAAFMKRELLAALDMAFTMLAEEPNCADLFATGGGFQPAPGPEMVLAQIENSITYSNILSSPGTITSAVTAGVGSPVTVSSVGDTYSAVSIELNNTTPGASFVSGTTYAQ